MTHDFSRLFIDGAWVDSDGGEILDVHNPANGELVGRAPQATVSDVRRAIAAARRASTRDHAAHDPARTRPGDAAHGRRPRQAPRRTGRPEHRRGRFHPALAEYLQVGIPLQHFRDMAERILPSFDFEKPVLPTIGQGIGQGVVLREPAGVAA